MMDRRKFFQGRKPPSGERGGYTAEYRGHGLSGAQYVQTHHDIISDADSLTKTVNYYHEGTLETPCVIWGSMTDTAAGSLKFSDRVLYFL